MSEIKEYINYYRESTTLFFGRYKNVPLSKVPIDYLKWVKHNTTMFNQFSRSLKRAINHNINRGND